MNTKTAIILAVVIVLVFLGSAAGYFWRNNNKAQNTNPLDNIGNATDQITNSASKGVLPSIQTNPLESKPDINPTGKANPFNNIKVNPF